VAALACPTCALDIEQVATPDSLEPVDARSQRLHRAVRERYYDHFGRANQMKILNRQKFMEMPPGTIFCKGEKWGFNQISFKGDTIYSKRCPFGSDFGYLDLCRVDAGCGQEWADALDKMLIDGTSLPFDNEGFGRDGFFDEKDLFLVFEKEDLLALRGRIDEAIAVCGESSRWTCP
jgi:hypothetical protein